MVELDLSFVSLIALAFAVGGVAGFLLRGLRRKRVEDMLEFFRQRDKEQDRKIANQERELSDARGRLLSMKADQGKGDKASGELRASLEEAQRTLIRLREEARLREESASSPAAPPVEPPVAAEAAETESASTAPAPAALPAPAKGNAGDGARRAGAKKGRLP